MKHQVTMYTNIQQRKKYALFFILILCVSIIFKPDLTHAQAGGDDCEAPIETAQQTAEDAVNKMKEKMQSGSFSGQAVPVNTVSINNEVAEILEQIVLIQNDLRALREKEFGAADNSKPALDSTAFCKANKVIIESAKAAAKWLSTAFGGNPAFPHSPRMFFKQISEAWVKHIIDLWSEKEEETPADKISKQLVLAKATAEPSFMRDRKEPESESSGSSSGGGNAGGRGTPRAVELARGYEFKYSPVVAIMEDQAFIETALAGAAEDTYERLGQNDGILSETDDEGNITTPGSIAGANAQNKIDNFENRAVNITEKDQAELMEELEEEIFRPEPGGLVKEEVEGSSLSNTSTNTNSTLTNPLAGNTTQQPGGNTGGLPGGGNTGGNTGGLPGGGNTGGNNNPGTVGIGCRTIAPSNSLTKSLNNNETGREVELLRLFLIDNQLLQDNSTTKNQCGNAIFNTTMRDALIQFQNNNQISPANGTTGRSTRNVINAMLST